MNNTNFNELLFYTLSHPDKQYFIHQLVVDAYTAQTATKNTKKISLVFSLVGLYLLIEKKYTGRKIQEAHLLLSKYKEQLPDIALPSKRGDITIITVLATTNNRDAIIKEWCLSVWQAYADHRLCIKHYCDSYLYKI